MRRPFFQSIPGFGAPPPPSTESRALTFDRNQVLTLRVGAHPDTPSGWACASMRCRIVSMDRCATFFDSNNTPDFHFKREGDEIVHYLRLRREDAGAVPEGWSNMVVDFANTTRIERVFKSACVCP